MGKSKQLKQVFVGGMGWLVNELLLSSVLISPQPDVVEGWKSDHSDGGS